MAGILDEIAAFLQKEQAPNPQLLGRHPSDNADMSALQLAPHMAKGLINDVARYGKQALTGQVSDTELLPQQPLTGNAKSIADAAGSAMGTALNYQVPSLLRGPRSAMDDINMVVDAYQGVRPGIVDAIGEPSVNRVEGAGLLGSMFIPAKVPKPKSGGLFSQAVIASDNLQRKTGNADGFFNDLTGKGQVKPDELNAMGFKEHFAGRNDVSRDEVRQFINDNQVQIKETVLGSGNKGPFDYYSVDDGPYIVYDGEGRPLQSFVEADDAQMAAERFTDSAGDQTKFSSYTLGGGDNYREILLQNDSSAGLLNELNSLNKQIGEAKVALRNDQGTLSNVADNMKRESDKFISMDKTKENYDNYQRVRRELSDLQDGRLLSDQAASKYIYGAKELIERRNELVKQKNNLPEPFINSNHFDEPNILAHLRMKDRVDADGNKTLLLEEVQSDLHQTGADSGYRSSQKKINQLQDNYDQLLQKDRTIDLQASRYLEENLDATDVPDELIGRSLENQRALLAAEYDLQEAVKGVPDVPFKTDDKSSWYNLALKRGLLEAVEGGYDKLALTTGRQQADRYDLSKQINEVRLGGNEQSGFTVSAFDNNDNPVIMESIDSLDALPNLIGKDAAKSLVNQPLTDTTSGSARILAGQDLSVGGEGMKQFYDRTLPNALGKLVKQDGVKVGQSELPRASFEQDNALLGELGLGKARASDIVHSVDITPKMRERVKKGLPLFATGGAAIGLTEMMSQQQQEDQRSGLFNSLQY